MKKFLSAIIISVFLLSSLSAIAQQETLLLFDSSISMGEKISGKPKYKIAAEEVRKVLLNLPDTEPIGLRVIGITINSNMAEYLKNPSELCKATSLLVPVQKYNHDNIINSLNGLFPLGTTPLVYAIDTAIKYDFTSNATLRHIILVTDGADGCNGIPCNYIKELLKYRNDVKIDIIAITVEPDELQQLKCLTDNTSGTLITVNTPDEIQKAFITLLKPTVTYPQKQKSQNIIYKNILLEFRQ